MDSPQAYKQAPAALQLQPITLDKAILAILKVPLPEYHVDTLTGEDIVKLLSYKQHRTLPKIAMCTYEFHLALKKLVDSETNKDPISLAKLYEANRSGLLASIIKELKKKHDSATGALHIKRKLRAHESHLRSQLTHAPEELSPEEYIQAISALKKGIETPEAFTPTRSKAFKASLEKILAREQVSSRFDRVGLESPVLALPDTRKRRNTTTIRTEETGTRKRRNTTATSTEETGTVKRSKRAVANSDEELEIVLFRPLDTDPSENDKGEGDNEPIVKPKTPQLPPLLLLKTPGLSLTMKELEM